MKKKVRHVSVLALCAMLLLCSGIKGSAFSLIGPNNPANFNAANYYTGGFAANAATSTPLNGVVEQGFLNHMDPMGWPVPIKQFYRWNWPELWYAFDSTFIRYFGQDGMQAVHNAFEVLGDYFEPQDKSYSGVSSMDLMKEFDQHFSTWKINPSAVSENVYDMETMVLGLLVNHMGLGNPHRHCFTIRDIYGYQEVPGFAAPAGNFQVAVRNYDPYTYQPASIINGVNYSYFIRADLVAQAGNPTVPRVFDAMEYSINSENKWSAIAGIRDIFVIGGSLPWPHESYIPTAYGPGWYVAPDDPRNRPAPSNVGQQVRSEPRHTLTFDDAGGLRYLYRTNNIVWETYDAQVQLFEVANMNPQRAASQMGSSRFGFPSQSIRVILGPNNNITPSLQFGSGGGPGLSGLFRPQPSFAQGAVASFHRGAMRGGIDKIKFHYLPYDSLLSQSYHTNFSVWRDVFVTNMLPTDAVPANPPYFSQIVGRSVTIPDFVFVAHDLGGLPAAGGAPTVITPPNPGAGPDWDDSMITINWSQNPLNDVPLGPGVILPPAGASIQCTFSTRPPFLVDIWAASGNEEEAVYRQQTVQQMQWGWITNTGPNDYITFPQDDVLTEMEATLGPAGTVAKITHLRVFDGLNEVFRSEPFDIDRSRDTITIHGQRLDSVSSIKILDHNTTENGAYKTLQTIEARRYIMSDQQIVLPPGILDNTTVSPATDTYYRRIALTNSKGESKSEFIYEISDGRPEILSTQYDGQPLNTARSLIIQGSGFISEQGNINQIWFFHDNNTTNYELEPNSGTGEFPVPVAILDIDPANTAYTSPSGVIVDYSEIVLTDSMIYLPQHILSDGNYTFGPNGFGVLNQGLNMARSEGNGTVPTIDWWVRHIRLAYNNDPAGQPNANVIMSPPRSPAQAYEALGVGGDRNSSISRYSSTMPTITDVFTEAAANEDENRTWNRGVFMGNTDVLVIRGIGLDMAEWIDFVDGEGNPIQTIDTMAATAPALTGWVPPWALALRIIGPPTGVQATGVTIDNYPPLGRDGYEIRIQPALFGMVPNDLWDSNIGLTPPNNQGGDRRVVIGTLFGTAVAPPRMRLMVRP
ncbi:MAG: hypothetical protein QF685_12245 [Verrucomicrobiota bacterium]|jgi:hypothetical protein|nr:hypothetical protein [Verrucomicrobiota bacterium]